MSTFESLLAKIQGGSDLTESEAQEAVIQIMEAKASVDQVKAFLLGLVHKGEALSEVVGAARAMRERAVPIPMDGRMVVDTCGTGGDGLKTVNISTMAAFVVAGAGVPVAKHGNRSITSSCGSADLLEALGVAIDVEPSVAERCLRQADFGFLFAPRFHPAMKAVGPIRKALGIPTIFNLLGPLTNPAGVRHQVVGVADSGKMELYARALKALGALKALVFRGHDGQDELSTTGSTEVIELDLTAGTEYLARYTVTPEAIGVRRAQLNQLRGSSPRENAKVAEGVLSGEKGPVRDAVLLNAAAALYVSGKARNLGEGLVLASQAIDQGKALGVLTQVRKLSRS